jgi:ComF family protein
MPGILLQPEQKSHEEARLVAGLLAYRDRIGAALDFGIELLFPPRCAGCGRVDSYWCERCEKALACVPIEAYFKHWEGLLDVVATGIHEGKLQQAIHALKYENLRMIAEPLGQRLVTCLAESGWAFDIIVPVPLHKERMAERGYNQAELLANAVADRLSVPCEPDAVVRARDTRSQVGLDRDQRRMNVADAFQADPDLVAHQTVLLVDDVCTTGATLGTCAEAALAAGAKAVYGVTVSTPHELF